MDKVEFLICIAAIFISACLCTDQSGNRRYSDILNVGFPNPSNVPSKSNIDPINLSYSGNQILTTSTSPRSTFSYSNALRGQTTQRPFNRNTNLPNNDRFWPQLPQRGPQSGANTQFSSSGVSNINPSQINTHNQNVRPQSANNNRPFSYSSIVGASNNNPAQSVTPSTTNTLAVRTNSPPKQIDTKSEPTTQPEIATETEIQEISEALLRKDTNNAAKYITVNYQGRTTSGARTDEAPLPLLVVNQSAFDIKTIALMKPLFNNYELDTAVNEHVTAQERNEENALLDAMLSTSLMRHLMNFFIEKGIVTRDPQTHKDLLKTIWFNLYSRGGGKIGSSAFEHVFLAELKNGEVTGLHNWIYFEEEERANHINYMGYTKKIELGEKGAVIKLRFTLNGVHKPVNSIFIGTSPEFEIALYTLCFMTKADKACNVSLNGQKVNIRTYTFRYRGKKMIGSAFPEI